MNQEQEQYYESTNVVNVQAFYQDAQVILDTKFKDIISYSICHTTKRIVLNSSCGFLILQNNKITKYEQNGPFRGQIGIKLSFLLSQSNLIALVPNKNCYFQNENSQNKKINSSSVYIYDLGRKKFLFQKDFNEEINYLKFTEKFIIVSNKKRVVIFDYKTQIKLQQAPYSILQLFSLYKKQTNQVSNFRYFLTGCNCDYDCSCGSLEITRQGPCKIGFLKSKGRLAVYDSEIDYVLEFTEDKLKYFALSPDGKYVAISPDGTKYIKIIQIKTRQVFTQYRRGNSLKKCLCMGFFNNWFGFVSQSSTYATLHLFELRKKNIEQQFIQSKFKRYFTTYNNKINFYVNDQWLILFTLYGGYYELVNVNRINEIHAQQRTKLIKNTQIILWGN